MVRKITSFFDEKCEWCKEIRKKHRVRGIIAEAIVPERATEFYELAEHGRCPFHKTTIYLPQTSKREIFLEGQELTVRWWSNNYEYKMIFNLEYKIITWWETDYKPAASVISENFDFNSLFYELLMLMNKEELERLREKLEELRVGEVEKECL